MRRKTNEGKLMIQIQGTFRRSATPARLNGPFTLQRGYKASRGTDSRKTGLIAARQRIFSRPPVSLDPSDSAPQQAHPPTRLSQMLKRPVTATPSDCLSHQITHGKEVHRKRNHTQAIPFIPKRPPGGFLTTRRPPHGDKRLRATEPRLTNRSR